MQLALLADSHGSLDRLDQALSNIENADIKHVIHAGDGLVYGLEAILAKYPKLNIYYALGNCDVNPELIAMLEKMSHVTIREVIRLELEDFKIGVSHIEGIAQNQLRDQKIDIFCHGHTHRPKAEKREGKIILNPGALTEDGNYFVLTLPELQLEVRRFDEGGRRERESNEQRAENNRDGL